MTLKEGDEVVFMSTFDTEKEAYLGQHATVVKPGASHSLVRFRDGKELWLMNNHLKGYD